MLIGILEVALKRLSYSVQLGSAVAEYSQALMESGLW